MILTFDIKGMCEIQINSSIDNFTTTDIIYNKKKSNKTDLRQLISNKKRFLYDINGY